MKKKTMNNVQYCPCSSFFKRATQSKFISNPLKIMGKHLACSNQCTDVCPKATNVLETLADRKKQKKTTMQTPQQLTTAEQAAMQKVHAIFKNALSSYSSVAAKTWMQEHGIELTESGAGYISARIHRSKPKEYKVPFELMNILTPHPTKAGHQLFGSNSIVFPLKDEENQLVNFYAIGITTNNTSYLNNEGLYPNYPVANTEKLYLTQNILDAASILQCKFLKENESVLALYDGEIKPQHEAALKKLSHLKEVILIE